MQTSSSTDELPAVEYEALDLSFDDIPPIESASSDPTEFVKPSAAQGGANDPFFQEDTYILGTLLVRIVAARNLPSVREGNVLQKLIPGQSFPANAYASVRFGTTTQRTTVVPGTNDPLWPRQEFLYMDVTHPVMNEINSSPMQDDNNDEKPSPGDPPRKKKLNPTMAKIPSKKINPKSAPNQSSSNGTKGSSGASSTSMPLSRNISTLSQRHPPPLDPPVLTVGLFHSTNSPKKYNPTKKNSGDSDDVFLGMTSMDVTALLTGKERSIDDWWPLQGGPDGDQINSRSPASVRVVVEYEPSDAAPRPGDKVRFTRFCHPHDLYPLLPYATYEVQKVEGDDATIGWTSPEGWYLSSIVRRHSLVCQERHVNVAEQILPHLGTIGERLGHSPLVQTLQTSVARVPDDGLLNVVGDALSNGKGLLSRWWQGGLGTAVEDVRHATNWDGQTMPTAEESLELLTPPSVGDLDESAVIPVEEDDSVATEKSVLPNMPLCPISQEPMKDPVVAADGHTYERAAIARWLRTSDKSPLTGAVMPHKELVPNYMLMSSLREAAAAAAAAATTPTASGNTLGGSANMFAGPLLDEASNVTPPMIDEEDDGELRDEDIE